MVSSRRQDALVLCLVGVLLASRDASLNSITREALAAATSSSCRTGGWAWRVARCPADV